MNLRSSSESENMLVCVWVGFRSRCGAFCSNSNSITKEHERIECGMRNGCDEVYFIHRMLKGNWERGQEPHIQTHAAIVMKLKYYSLFGWQSRSPMNEPAKTDDSFCLSSSLRKHYSLRSAYWTFVLFSFLLFSISVVLVVVVAVVIDFCFRRPTSNHPLQINSSGQTNRDE